jgi:hypothetical protein
MKTRVERQKFKSLSRRELLKLTPVVALGAFFTVYEVGESTWQLALLRSKMRRPGSQR